MTLPRHRLAQAARTGLAAIMILIAGITTSTAADRPAKELFGAKALPANAKPQTYGFYNKGCIAGAVAIPSEGPTWQAMRLSRNRRWGHPAMIGLIERLSKEAAQYDGWPGLLIGDIAQPRGGPMLSGHASHQVGLDADIWLNPMPDRTLSYAEREKISAKSMLKKGTLQVDPKVWTNAHARLIMRAASYPEVQRIFVHPGIKKKLCDSWTGDRSALGKVRPYWGHHYHFHIRIHCQPGSPGCKPQSSIPRGDGCDKSLAWWFTDEPWRPAKPAKPGEKPKKKRGMGLAALPKACRQVLNAAAPASEMAATYRAGGPDIVSIIKRSETPVAASTIPVPVPRPTR